VKEISKVHGKGAEKSKKKKGFFGIGK